MPANHPPDARRGKVPQALFWAGMALAPVAVLILLFGQSTGALRAAVVLAVLTIVLLAVSMAMRPSVDMVRVDIEHRVLDEMERIRMRTRDESAMVAHHTARALADRIHAMNVSLEELRSQVDEVQAIGFVDPHRPPALGPGHGPPGVRRTESVHITRRTTYDDTGSVYGSRSAYEHGRSAVDGEWREDRYERWEGGDDRQWSMGRPEQRALPPARGEPAGHYADDRYDRGHDRDRYDRDRGYDRYGEDRYHDDRYRDDRYRDDRYSDDRHHDDRHRDDRYHDDRHHDDRYRDDRFRDDRYRDRYDERDRHRYDDRYERDRGYDRGYDDRRHAPRPRSSEW